MKAVSESRTDILPVLSDFAGQGVLYDGLIRTLQEGTFVHAYLISGPSGVGKRSLARLMAQYLLCAGEGKPCGQCPACIQVRDGNHPDVIIERPGEPLCPDVEAGRKMIPVDEIRYIISLVGQHTFVGGNRVVIIEQADRMNPNAANALLKSLEEPLAGTVYLLLTDAPEQLLPTIVSRCRPIKLHPWTDAYVRQTLVRRGVEKTAAGRIAAVSGGSIGKAIEIAGDERYWQLREDVMADFFALASRGEILRVSSAWKDRKGEADALLNTVEELIRALLLVRLEQQDGQTIAEYPEAWRKMAASAELKAFIDLMDAVGDARRTHSSNVTWQVVLERLLLRMMEEKSKWST